MILPTKHLSEEKSLIVIGAKILNLLEEPKTVSRIWNEFQTLGGDRSEVGKVTYSWFILSLDLLYLFGAVQFDTGRVSRVRQ